jgi:hypothetical protein
MLLATLPGKLEDPKALVKRRKAAANRKELWRSIYKEAYDYTMPERETFNQYAPGQRKNRHLYDSTGIEATHKAANRMQADLCPPWREWAQLAPGADIEPEIAEDPEIIEQLQDVTATFFHYLNHSNFATVANETMLDILVGTGTMALEEGEGDDLFRFDAVPLSGIELEEGPRGTIETVWRPLEVPGRHLERMFDGIQVSPKLAKQIEKNGEKPVKVIHGVVYEPKLKKYYGVVLEEGTPHIAWRWDYGQVGPYITARATVVAGEIYGRGPVLWALPNIKSANAMIEFMLRHSAIQIAPPATAVSDGVLNPYTAALRPNTIIPVANHDSLRPLELGGNFMVGEALLERIQGSIKRTLLDDERRAEGPVRTATEIMIEDRELIKQWGAVFGRIQAELLAKIVERGVAILAKNGKIPPIEVDGRMLTVKYVSPLARAQDQEDLAGFGMAMEMLAPLGPEILGQGIKVEEIPAYVWRKTGSDSSLVRTEAEKRVLAEQAQQAAAAAAAAEGGGENVVPIRGAR